MGCRSKSCGSQNPCRRCNQSIITPACSRVCEFQVNSSCVILDDNITCLDVEIGDTLNEVLLKICTLSNCNELTWITPDGAREGIDTIEYALGCNNKVYLRGFIVFDDIPVNTVTNIELPIPSTNRLLTINAIEDDGDSSTIVPTVFGIVQTTGSTFLLYNEADTISTPPTLLLSFDGQSYYI